MEAKPLRSFPSSDSENGGGPRKSFDDNEWTVMMEEKKCPVKEEPPSIKLGLGIGANLAQKPVIAHGKPMLTPAQLHELQQQALIFKYIVASLPVPIHLVLPIWKSVASSFGSSNGGIYKQYPSFVGFSPQGFDYRNMMDPEPGRCRRTDGKKWRCGKNVVLDQKYCERHMHRGRQRSRKHVESPIAQSSDTTPSNNSTKDSDNSKTILTHRSLQLPSPSTGDTSNRVKTTATTTMSSNIDIDNKVSSIKNFTTTMATTAIATDSTTTYTNTTSSFFTPSPTPINTTTTMSTTTTTTIAAANTTTTPNNNNNNNNNNKNNHNIDRKGDGSNCATLKNIINRSNNNGNNTNVSNISPGLGFSPKSVLQVLGCSGSCSHRSEIELEPGRCRRTDGKKWRCSREVVPEQKYCTRHMHRGAKKHVEVSHPSAVPSAATAATVSARPPDTLTKHHKADSATLSTNLCIAIPTSSQLMANDENCTTSSSSDTTLTDTTIAAYGNFSS